MYSECENDPKTAKPRPKVFGIGWAKTGTTTLGTCLQILGYHHVSHRRDLINAYADGDIQKIIDAAREPESFEDWPWLILYKELDSAYPESLFVLTKRQPDKWLCSYRNMLSKQGIATPEMNRIRRVLYGLDFPDITDSELLDRYHYHNSCVINYFRERPESLLVTDWESGDGWQELCNFLGAEKPFRPFPHKNKGDYNWRHAK